MAGYDPFIHPSPNPFIQLQTTQLNARERYGSSNERTGAVGFSFRSRRIVCSRCWQTHASISSQVGMRTPFASDLDDLYDATRNCHLSKSFTRSSAPRMRSDSNAAMVSRALPLICSRHCIVRVRRREEAFAVMKFQNPFLYTPRGQSCPDRQEFPARQGRNKCLEAPASRACKTTRACRANSAVADGPRRLRRKEPATRKVAG